MIPIVLALMATVFFSLSSIVMRYFVSRSNGTLTAQRLVADAYLILGLVLLGLFLAIKPEGYPTLPLVQVGVLSILSAFGSFLQTEAIVYGKGGPAQALQGC